MYFSIKSLVFVFLISLVLGLTLAQVDDKLEGLIKSKKNLLNGYKLRNLPNCGKSYVRPNLNNGRIIKGFDAVTNSWPWMVSIQLYDKNTKKFSHNCGGSIISDRYVLTAAHCVNFDVAKNFLIYTGINDFNKVDYCDKYTVEKIYFHSKFDEKNLENGNDVALIKLNRPIRFSKKVNSVCLPNSVKDSQNVIKKNVVAIGWGYIGFKESNPIDTDKMKQTQLQVIDGENVCTESGEFNSNLLYCVMNQKTKSNICQGDSGGPLLYSTNNKWTVYGIVSYTMTNGKRCDNTKPSYFTEVAKYLDWIKKAMFYLDKVAK